MKLNIRSHNTKETRPPSNASEHRSVFAILAAESDRGCLLVAAAAIEEELETLLRTYFAMANAPRDSEGVVNLL